MIHAGTYIYIYIYIHIMNNYMFNVSSGLTGLSAELGKIDRNINITIYIYMHYYTVFIYIYIYCMQYYIYKYMFYIHRKINTYLPL